jgi:hypothetical protein
MGLRQGCVLSPVFINLYIDEVLTKLNKANTHAPVLGKRQIPALLFADDLAVGTMGIMVCNEQ